MYTQCPDCGTVFRVTAPVLRAAQGQVRCGVCDANFDALRFLTDDIDTEVSAASASAITGARAAPTRPAATPPADPVATRNRPSADEERALGEIAAALARGAQPAIRAEPAREPPAAASKPAAAPQPAPASKPAASARPTAAPQPAATSKPAAAPQPAATSTPAAGSQPATASKPAAARQPAAAPQPGPAPQPADASKPTAASKPAAARQPAAAPQPVAAPKSAAAPRHLEVNILEPVDVEDFVLGDDIPDAALEFDLPPEGWSQVFVSESASPAMTPLDLDLGPPAPPADGAPVEAAQELALLEERHDPLARTDEYEIPAFAAAFRTEAPPESTAIEFELEPAALTELELESRPEPLAARREPEPEPDVAPAAATRRTRPRAPARAPLGDTATEWPDSDATVLAAERPEALAGPVRAAGIAATVLLALLFGAQLVHYYRDSLADSPLVGPALGAFYARIGRPLEPRWDLTAYDVRQWGAQSEDTAGRLRLRASIVNRAARSQPYPLLRVMLEDRFGTQVGRREFTPAEYLPGRSTPRELLAPGARADADLSLADPGNQAVGFELDVCLTRHAALVCGADAKQGGG